MAIITIPGWGPTPSSLASLRRELFNCHRREGCTLELENGKTVVLGPGEGIGHVARALSEMLRLQDSFLASELFQMNKEALEGIVNEWEHFYRAVDNVAGRVGFFRRLSLVVGHFQKVIFGSVSRPPLE